MSFFDVIVLQCIRSQVLFQLCKVKETVFALQMREHYFAETLNLMSITVSHFVSLIGCMHHNLAILPRKQDLLPKRVTILCLFQR